MQSRTTNMANRASATNINGMTNMANRASTAAVPTMAAITGMMIFSFEDEFNFWGLQVKEHMLFTYQGLVEDLVTPNNLRQQASDLHNSWHTMLASNRATQPNFKAEVLVLLNATLEYQIAIQKLIENNIWIGWLSYSFMDHLINESYYFLDKINNPDYDLKREREFWLLHHQTEIEASEKLLDPLEMELSELAKIYVNQVKELRLDLDLLNATSSVDVNDLSNTTMEVLNEYLLQTGELRDGIQTKTVLTNISLPLINHVIREGERAIQIFTALGQ